MEGSYLTENTNENDPLYNKYTLQHATFPITLLLSFESEKVNIQIINKASWTVKVKLDK